MNCVHLGRYWVWKVEAMARIWVRGDKGSIDVGVGVGVGEGASAGRVGRRFGERARGGEWAECVDCLEPLFSICGAWRFSLEARR